MEQEQGYDIVLIQSISLNMSTIIPRLVNYLGVDPNKPIEVYGIFKYPLIESVKFSHLDCLKSLVRVGAVLSNKDEKGFSSLHYACMFEDEDVFNFVLSSSPSSMNSVSNDGLTPLDVAADYGNVYAIDKLCSSGAISGSGILSDASSIHIDHLTKIFNIKPLEFGQQVMRTVVYNDKETLVKLLKENRIPIHFVDEKGNSLLHVATKLFYIDVVIILLKAGCDIYKKNNNKVSPLDLASSAIHGDGLKEIMINFNNNNNN